ncbi:MAG: hypothetical protein B7Z45_08175, partial [Azorhizobium sp. 12-66-6]
MGGTMMNSHNCASALPPANSAGPMLRAGLTDTPVTGMNTMWIITSDRPMARPAAWVMPAREVEPRMTTRKTKVPTSSAITAMRVMRDGTHEDPLRLIETFVDVASYPGMPAIIIHGERDAFV